MPVELEQIPLRGVSRNRQFDLLRVLFATLVLLTHASGLTDGNASRDLFARLTRSSFSFADLGVDGFFLLSGYLIVQSWLGNPELVNFLRKRVLRIVPGYLVAALLSTVVIGEVAPGIQNFFRHFAWRFPISLLLLGSPVTPPVLPGWPFPFVNGSLWTIAYEFRCYLIVAFFGACGLLRRSVWVAVTSLLLTIALLPALEQKLCWHGFLMYVGEPKSAYRLTLAFFVGGCFQLFRRNLPFRVSLALISAGTLFATLATSTRLMEPALLLLGGYLLFYAARTPFAWVERIHAFPDISYGIYLYGWPVEVLWILFFRGSPWLTFLASAILCFALGWVSWHFVERPMLSLKRRPTAPLPPP